MDIMLYGEEKFQGSIAKALVGFILRAVHENELALSKATDCWVILPIYPAPFPVHETDNSPRWDRPSTPPVRGPGPSHRESAKIAMA
jgi:hypothetical protein